MPFTAVCPNCGTRLTAPDAVRGKKVRCKKCDEKFVAEPVVGEDDEVAPPAKPDKAAARSRRYEDEDEAPRGKSVRSRRPDDEDDDDAPARRRSRDDDDDDEDDDDEPRAKGKPAGKKKVKKKKRGSPALMPAVIGLGAVVLIGGGIGVYYGLLKEKPAEPPPPVHLEVLTPPIMGNPIASGPGGAAAVKPAINWIEYSSPDGLFTAKFPVEPTHSTPTVQGPTGPVPTNQYLAESPQLIALVASAEVPGFQADMPQKDIDRALDAACDALVKRFPGAQQVGRTNITHQGFAGRDVGISAPDGSGGTARVFIANGRMYSLMAATKVGKPDPANVRTFFDGFKVQT
jgi:hypothetical protein